MNTTEKNNPGGRLPHGDECQLVRRRSGRRVIVNDVEVDFYDDEAPDPGAVLPMRAPLELYERCPGAVSPGAIQRLREAGVEELPLYATSAREAGIAWREIPAEAPAIGDVLSNAIRELDACLSDETFARTHAGELGAQVLSLRKKMDALRAALGEAPVTSDRLDETRCDHGSSAEVVEVRTVDPTSGRPVTEPWYGVAVAGQYGDAISRSAPSLEELAELVGGDLSNERALWLFIQNIDCSIGTFDGELIDPVKHSIERLGP